MLSACGTLPMYLSTFQASLAVGSHFPEVWTPLVFGVFSQRRDPERSHSSERWE